MKNLKNLNRRQKVLIVMGVVFGLILLYIFFTVNKNKKSISNDYVFDVQEEKQAEETDEETGYIYVHIIGEVNNNGLIKLKEGDRLVNAIEAAGGVTEKADLSKVNLAFVLSDGNKIRIPSIDDKDTSIITSDSGDNVIISENLNIKVNINTATQSELETLTGVGPSMALKIIEYRNKNGKFKKIEDLKNVGGIGEQKFNGLKNEITIK